MKLVARMLAVAVLLVSTTVFAAGLDGSYTYKSRMKAGAPDEGMKGLIGTMTIANNVMTRNFKDASGKLVKFYVSSLTKESGDTYLCKFTDAYKKEYIGMENKNIITPANPAAGVVVTMKAVDNSFSEEWIKN